MLCHELAIHFLFMYVIGLQVSEVAHDIQQQVSRYIVSLGFVNSYDTWYGTGTTTDQVQHVYMCMRCVWVYDIDRDKECNQTDAKDFIG